eukprot:11182694-Lingulodinium_polyedra.AAC.1
MRRCAATGGHGRCPPSAALERRLVLAGGWHAHGAIAACADNAPSQKVAPCILPWVGPCRSP